MQEITMQVGEAKITLSTETILKNFIATLGKEAGKPSPAAALNHPELNEGEHYAGIILGKNGEPDHHLILLPGEAIDINWEDAKDWAAEQGGELPTRREQSLLFANLKERFQPRWHWSCEEHESDAHFAWVQDFSGGSQGYGVKVYEYCARAVRRVSVI